MATKGAYKRLTKEYINIQKGPPAYLYARPLESNILEWHYVLKGPPATPYFGGEYHGKLIFPSEYPFKPPSIRMITPNGRFQVDTRLCLSMSDFHPGTWNPSWSVATILNGLLSFMSQEESTTGSIITTPYEKTIYAARSHAFNMRNNKFREIFPELVAPEQVPLHVAFPNAPATETAPPPSITPAAPVGAVRRRPTVGAGQAGVPVAGAVVAGGATTTTAAHARPHGSGQAATGATAAAGAQAQAQGQVALGRRSYGWQKWVAFFLVFAYLLVAKTLTRASASS
ncbi:Ubiquitin-conjugating enzyme E2 6 [Actinomortierella ambigua]|nr:Ubiquitin-conjugating enzyme E2 6 [Actinomortierella ambigua]